MYEMVILAMRIGISLNPVVSTEYHHYLCFRLKKS